MSSLDYHAPSLKFVPWHLHYIILYATYPSTRLGYPGTEETVWTATAAGDIIAIGIYYLDGLGATGLAGSFRYEYYTYIYVCKGFSVSQTKTNEKYVLECVIEYVE